MHRPLATNQQDSSTSTSLLLPLTRLPPRSDRGSQDATSSDSDLSDLEEEEDEEEGEADYYKSNREQPWSDKEIEVE